MAGIRIERLGRGDEERILAAAALFDEAPTERYVQRFLSAAGHHLLVAYEGSEPVGFVSGVEVAHPDKPVEMFLNELGVRDESQGRGVGRALVSALWELAVQRGCAGMWVLTDADNTPARRTYLAAGGIEAGRSLMLEWTFTPEATG